MPLRVCTYSPSLRADDVPALGRGCGHELRGREAGPRRQHVTGRHEPVVGTAAGARGQPGDALRDLRRQRQREHGERTDLSVLVRPRDGACAGAERQGDRQRGLRGRFRPERPASVLLQLRSDQGRPRSARHRDPQPIPGRRRTSGPTTSRANNFATNWSPSPSHRVGPRAPPETAATSASPGMNDSPGAAPAASTLRRVTSKLLDGGASETPGACELKGSRFVHKGTGGTFTYTVFADGTPVTNLSGVTPAEHHRLGDGAVPDRAVPRRREGQVSVRFDYTAGSSPTAADGVWLDDLRVECRHPISDPDDLNFLAGTSMAAAARDGGGRLDVLAQAVRDCGRGARRAAGLGRQAPAWNGVVATGGRLDTAAALGRLVPPDTRFVNKPRRDVAEEGRVQVRQARLRGRRDVPVPADAAAYATCAQNKAYSEPLPRQPHGEVRARDLYGNVDPTPGGVHVEGGRLHRARP